MKLLLDNNLSYKLVQPLNIPFQGTVHIRVELSVLANDITIWNYAKANGFTIITKDNDFDDRSLIAGCPPKIIHLVCGNKSTRYILNLILLHQKEFIVFVESDSENCILKVS